MFVQIRQRVSAEATFNKAKLTKLIGERWVGSDVLDWNLRTFEEKIVCVCVQERIIVSILKIVKVWTK